MLYAAYYALFCNLLKKKEKVKEFISFGAGLFPFLMFSLSSFQLPHYLNIVFPFYTVLTAQWLANLPTSKSIMIVNIIQVVISGLLLLLACVLLYLFGIKEWWLATIFILIVVTIMFLFKRKLQPTEVLIPFFSSCMLFLVLNLLFYPALLQYQSGTKAAEFMNSKMPKDTAAVFEIRSYSFEFAMKKAVRHMNFEDLNRKLPNDALVLFTKAENINKLLQKNYNVEVLDSFEHFHISRLSYKFINTATRDKETKPYVLVRVK